MKAPTYRHSIANRVAGALLALFAAADVLPAHAEDKEQYTATQLAAMRDALNGVFDRAAKASGAFASASGTYSRGGNCDVGPEDHTLGAPEDVYPTGIQLALGDRYIVWSEGDRFFEVWLRDPLNIREGTLKKGGTFTLEMDGAPVKVPYRRLHTDAGESMIGFASTYYFKSGRNPKEVEYLHVCGRGGASRVRMMHWYTQWIGMLADK